MCSNVFSPGNPSGQGRTFLSSTFAALGNLIEHRRRPLLILAGILTLCSLAAIPTVTFDYNLLNLQAHGTESVEWEKRIIANSERASWNALATAPTAAEAIHKAAAFAALPSVETVESVASFIPSGQEKRLPLVQILRPLLEHLPPALTAPVPVEVPALQQSLDQIRFKVRANNKEWNPDTKPAESDLSAARARLKALVTRLQMMPESQAQAALDQFQSRLFQDFGEKWALLRNNVNPSGPISLADIPPNLKNVL